MTFDMDSVFAMRRETEHDEPALLACDEPDYLSIRDIRADFLAPAGDGDLGLVAKLDGALVLGAEVDRTYGDLWLVCDSHSGELEAMASLARDAGVAETDLGSTRTILYIRQLDLSRDLLDADNLSEFFDLLPAAAFMLYNVRPDLLCYLVAERDGYYDETASKTALDPRSVDGYSPLIYTACGFTLNPTGELLYRLVPH